MIFWPNYRYTDLIPYGPETEDQYSSRWYSSNSHDLLGSCLGFRRLVWFPLCTLIAWGCSNDATSVHEIPSIYLK